MIEVGKTYKAGNGNDVKICDEGRFKGDAFFIAKISWPQTGDQVAAYAPDGTYIPPADKPSKHDLNLIVPSNYVRLDQVIAAVRDVLRGSSNASRIGLIARLEQLPSKELTDA